MNKDESINDIKMHASRADALGYLAAEDCKSAKILFEHNRWRESAIFSLQSMEKYIGSASESIPVKFSDNSDRGQVHSLDQAVDDLADRIRRYNQDRDDSFKNGDSLEAALKFIRTNVLEGFDYHKMHNFLRYPRWNKLTNSYVNLEADERIASALMSKISDLCLYINDIKKFCVEVARR